MVRSGWLSSASALPDDIQAVWRTMYTRTYSSQAAGVTSPYLQRGERLANWLQAMLQFLHSSPGNDQRPFLFSGRPSDIYLSILDSSILSSWAPCTLFFHRYPLVIFKMLWIFSGQIHAVWRSLGKTPGTVQKRKQNYLSSDFISTLELLQSSNSPDYIVLKDESIINNG